MTAVERQRRQGRRPRRAAHVPDKVSPTTDMPAFSNFAVNSPEQNHTIAGPGVCILSDWPTSSSNTISGTSMATPHVTGAVALCLGQGGAPGPCTGLTPAQIVQKMRSDAASHASADTASGFVGDPAHPVIGRYYGNLVWAGGDLTGGPGATVPGAPTLNSASAGDTQVILSWSAPTSNGGAAIDGYYVYRNGAKVSGGVLVVGTSFTDTSLTNGVPTTTPSARITRSVRARCPARPARPPQPPPAAR